MNEIPFSFDAPSAQVTDEEVHEGPAPEQSADGDEYICGNTGGAHPYANPGRDQDRSRADECVPASPFARYVS